MIDSRARHALSKRLKRKHEDFINNNDAIKIPKFFSKTKAVRTSVISLMRKQPGSSNAAKEIPRISKLIFGLMEEAKAKKIQNIGFEEEVKIVNDTLISVLDARLQSKYNGKCGYGESILNGYLDIFITATLPNTHRAFEQKPTFLVNPATGMELELDVMMEDFRLAFEFQGIPTHYWDPDVIEKDAFKLKECAKFSRVLIPVNIFQLSGQKLSELILNSIIPYLGISALFEESAANFDAITAISDASLYRFSKVTHRIYLANLLYGDAISCLDGKSSSFISAMESRSPISSTQPAPRLYPDHRDISVHNIYRYLPNVRRLRDFLKKPKLDHKPIASTG